MKQCNESYSKDGWHFKTCYRPAKYIITRIDSSTVPIKTIKGYRCGLHAKRYKDRQILLKGDTP